jgi:single-strand DNA-binding protein
MTATNQIVIIGRLGQDPEIRQVNGTALCEISLAVNRPTKGPDGNYVTDWIRCQFWDKRAETLSTYVKKGQMISVTGSLRIDTWEKDGQKQSRAYVHVEGFQMLGSKSDNQSTPQQTQAKASYQAELVLSDDGEVQF